MVAAVRKARQEDAKGGADCMVAAVRKARQKVVRGGAGHAVTAVRKARQRDVREGQVDGSKHGGMPKQAKHKT